MNRVESILLKARNHLADPHKSRWTDDNLLAILSEGQQDLASQALLLKKWVDLPVFYNESTYKLPEDFIKLETAYILDEEKTPLKYISYQDLDKRKRQAWEDQVGKPEFIVYDLARNSSEFMIYPKPDKETEAATLLFDGDPYGVITSADGIIIKSQFGTITSSNIEDFEFASRFGIVTNILEVTNYLRLCYHYKPKDITSLEQELEIMPAMDKALKHYVVAQALRNDMDSMNVKIANEEFQFYNRELLGIISDSSRDYIHTKEELLQTRYDGGF